jgi:outer membrane protein assembly factor BamB
MRKFFRIVIRVFAALIVLAAGAYFVSQWISKRQTEQNLAKQAVEIAAHRQAQQAAAPATPSEPASTAAPAPSSTPVAAVAWTKNWTDFRGARRDGRYSAAPIRTDWASLKPMWRQPVGGGHSSFVAAEGRAFTIEQRGKDEVAAAYDVLTGRELWTNAWNASFIESMGGPGPRATPTFHEGTLFALGATGELRALDASTGKLRWRTNILEDANAGNLSWGMAASPLIVGNTVVTVPGGGNGHSIAAYDLATGKLAWSSLDDEAAYTSPVRVTLAEVDQIVVFLAARVVGISPDRGALLWEFPWSQDNNAAQPLVIDHLGGGNRLFISSGSGGALIEIAREGQGLKAREVWRTNRMKNGFSSSVHHDGFIYGLDLGILACIDAATGDLKWKGGRYGNGQVLLSSGHLVITSDDGDVVLVRATPEGHQELAKVSGLDGQTWNNPALADGFLLVRNSAQMAAFDLRPR